MTINGIAVTNGQAAVHNVLRTYGPLPDHALVPLAQHVAQTHQSSSGIRSRRVELARKGLVAEKGIVRTASGRQATTWEAL